MKLFLSILFVLFSISAFTQTFEIQLVNDGAGVLSIQLRETSGTTPSNTDALTDLVFGIKWQTSYGVDLGNINNTGSYNMVKSGGRTTKGSFHFQAFGANSTPFVFPTSWTTNTWTEIMTIPVLQTGTGTGTFEITEAGFDVTTDPNIGVNLSDFPIVINGSATGVALPVELIRFEALPDQNAIRLNWEAASEELFDGYELQRSVTGKNEDFEKIAWISSKGKNNQDMNYQHLDESVEPNIVYFYRLKMLDLDGSFEYSKITNALIKGDAIKVSVTPNPFKDSFQIEITKPSSIRLVGSNGTLLYEQKNAQVGSTRISTSDLPDGTYHLHIIQNSGGDAQSVTLVKQ